MRLRWGVVDLVVVVVVLAGTGPFGTVLARGRRDADTDTDTNDVGGGRAAAGAAAERRDSSTSTIQEAVKSLLGFKDLPRKEAGLLVPNASDMKMAPRYMLDLYNKYKDGRIIRNKSGQLANTVRSIHAEVGIVNDQPVFIFNLTSIAHTEKVLKSEIHVYKRQRSHGTDILMDIHELSPTYLRTLDRRSIPGETFGWQATEVTSSVRSCLRNSQLLPRLLAVSFNIDKSEGRVKRLSLRHLIRRLSRPFLIVFSNDTQNITLDHINPHINPEDLGKTYIDPENGERRDFSSLDRSRRHSATSKDHHRTWPESESFDTKEVSDEDEVKSGDSPAGESDGIAKIQHRSKHTHLHGKENPENDVGKNKRRIRRSIHDNEIPEDPDETLQSPRNYNLPRTHPGILQGRTKSRQQQLSNSKLIPYPEDYKRQKHSRRRKHGRRNNNKKRKNKRKLDQRRGPAAVDTSDWDIDKYLSPTEKSRLCGKRELVVDFADVGWSDWIISPKSFKANYCGGHCPFPMAQRLKPSNHATIQSLVHAVGIHTDVPAPCCVPETLSSVTVLYFDENKNVVLKNYPDMSVESCACR